MPERLAHLIVTAGLASGLAATSAVAQSRGEGEFGLMVEAPGVEETFYGCTACHSEMIIVQQGKTRQHWDDLLVWMVDEQGMTPFDDAERDVILDYLAANYNEDRPNFPAR